MKKYTGREYTRHKVRERDNYSCRDCGQQRTPEFVKKANINCIGLKNRIRLFDVHHLNGLCGKKSRKYDSIKDIDNLITLCHKCHFNRPEHTCRIKNNLKKVVKNKL